MLAAGERPDGVVLAIHVDLKPFGGISLAGGHGNADVGIVENGVVAEHGADEVDHRLVQVEFVEVVVLADDGVCVAQIVGLCSSPPRHFRLGVECLDDCLASGLDFGCC